MKRIFTKRVIILLFTIVLGFSNLVSAMPVLWVGDVSGNLGTVDVANGNVAVIGNMGHIMTDIAFDTSGNLYGVTFGSLYSINKNNAAASFIGNLGTSANSLTFDASGTLYTANNMLYTVNVGTGATTLVGNGGDSYASAGDLAFVGGNLYISSVFGEDSLVTLNPGSGVGTTIGNIGFGSVYGLATDNNVNLYGVTGTRVIDINVTTGAGTFLVDYFGKGLGEAWGSAFETEANSVPEPGTFLLLVSGLMGLVGYRWRQRGNGITKERL